MTEKTVHIVFQVLNFLISNESKQYNLLLIDKWLLTILAKHHGNLGIFPNQITLANEGHITLRYVKIRIKHLESIGLISIKRVGRKNHYDLNFLSTIGEPQFPNDDVLDETIGELQITSKVNYRSPHRGTTVHTNNKLNNLIKKTERGTAKRSPPLSVLFLPNEANEMLCRDLGLTMAEQLESFKNRHKRKKTQFEFSEWLKSAKEYSVRNPQPKHEPKSTVPFYGPGHPTYDALHGNGEPRKVEEEVYKPPVETPESIKASQEGLAKFRESVRLRKLTEQGTLPNGHDKSGDSSG